MLREGSTGQNDLYENFGSSSRLSGKCITTCRRVTAEPKANCSISAEVKYFFSLKVSSRRQICFTVNVVLVFAFLSSVSPAAHGLAGAELLELSPVINLGGVCRHRWTWHWSNHWSNHWRNKPWGGGEAWQWHSWDSLPTETG